MFRLLGLAGLLLAAFGVAGLWLTRPQTIPADDLAALTPDLARGEWVFHASGCASCHAAPDAEDAELPVLAGGARFDTDFGTFIAPNISPHPTAGIGGWSDAEIVTALARGTSPDGRHYYPSFPYPAYAKAELSDLVSLAAYLRTLPPDPTPSQPHEIAFPYSIRAGLGLWKALYVTDDWVIDTGGDGTLTRGRYLAEALAHCGECHTPRDRLGGLDLARWFGGAPNPSGRGRIPPIDPGHLTWTAAEIGAYLTDGFTPDFDVAGGSMRPVVESMARLAPEDREAIAAYLKAVPPLD